MSGQQPDKVPFSDYQEWARTHCNTDTLNETNPSIALEHQLYPHKKAMDSALNSPPMIQECYKLMRSVGEYVDPTLLTAYEFLATQARSELRSKADYLKALAGCRAAKSLFGAHQDYSRALENISRQLLAELPLVLQLQQAWFQDDVRRAWEQVLASLEKSLPRDTLQEVRALMASVFDGDPPG